ncbi:hypothetical protein RJT34_25125 [Clitoria ternatea]|uniref:RNase H type-1 domain-containing protein n=1 Tax=Clitoria ternatea TaxID=43366 RepID=A0AAN9FW07_CLITE
MTQIWLQKPQQSMLILGTQLSRGPSILCGQHLIPVMEFKAKTSKTWRAICSAWKQIQCGIVWNFGNRDILILPEAVVNKIANSRVPISGDEDDLACWAYESNDLFFIRLPSCMELNNIWMNVKTKCVRYGDIKLNVDCSFWQLNGLLRDASGSFIGGFMMNIGQRFIRKTELMSTEQGLKLAWNLGVRMIQVEVNSVLACGGEQRVLPETS